MVDLLTGNAWALWASMRAQVLDMRSSQPAILVSVVQPAVLMVLLGGTRGQRHPDPTGVVIGVMLTALWAATIWSAGSILRREIYQGTLAATLTGVRSPFLVLCGKCLAASAVTITVIVSTCVACVAALRLPVHPRHPLWLVAGCAVVAVAGAMLGALLASLFLVTRYGQQVSSALMYPVFILGGMLIPPGALPAALRWPSLLLSFSWGQRFLVAAAGGRPRYWSILVAAALAVGYGTLARAVFTRAVRIARTRGSLDLI